MGYLAEVDDIDFQKHNCTKFAAWQQQNTKDYEAAPARLTCTAYKVKFTQGKKLFKREGEVKKEMVRSKSLNLMFLRPNTKMIIEFQKNNVHLSTYLQRMFKYD